MRQLSLPFVYPLHNWQCFFLICLNLVLNPIIQLTRVVIVVYCLDKGRVGTYVICSHGIFLSAYRSIQSVNHSECDRLICKE